MTGFIGSDSIWDLNDQNTKHEPPKGSGHDYIRMVGVDTATGLEAKVVFLRGFEDLWGGAVAAADSQSDQPGKEEEREEAVRKMYMAMTRASSQLILITYGQTPPVLKKIFD